MKLRNLKKRYVLASGCKSQLTPEQEQIARDFLEADVYQDPKNTLADILTVSTTTDSRS